jgi:hypothetical protein
MATDRLRVVSLAEVLEARRSGASAIPVADRLCRAVSATRDATKSWREVGVHAARVTTIEGA